MLLTRQGVSLAILAVSVHIHHVMLSSLLPQSLLLLLTPCLGLAILPTSITTSRTGGIGGVPRLGTLDINGDPVITSIPTALPTTSTSGSGLLEQQQQQQQLTEKRMTNNWSNRGMYVNRDIGRRRSNVSGTRAITNTKINLLDRPTNTPLYCLTVTLQIKPERHSDFLSCISQNQYHTLTSEPNAITYIYGQDNSIANKWHFFEQYINGKDGFIAHTTTKHFGKWEEFVTTDPFTSSPRVQFFIEDTSSLALGKSVSMTRDALLAYSGNGYHATIKLYCKNVQLIVIPEKRIDFLNAIRAYQQRALSTPNDNENDDNNNNDIVSCTFGEDVEQMNTFYIFEAYTTNSRQQQKEEEEKFMEEFLVSPPKIDYYEIQLPYGVMN